MSDRKSIAGVGQSDRYPRLAPEELTRELKKLQTEICPSFWRNPTAEDVQGLYSVAVEFILGKRLVDIRIEEMGDGDLQNNLPALAALDILPQEGALHFRAVGNLRFLRYCQYLCHSVLGFTDFTRQDLMSPTPDRLIKFASAFVNFVRFRESILNRFQHQMEEIMNQSRGDKELDDEYRSCVTKLSSLQEERNDKMTLTQERKTLQQALLDQLSALSPQYKTALSQAGNMQKENQALETQLKNVEFELTTIRQKNQELKVRLVHDPNKLRSELVRLDNDIRDHNAELNKTANTLLNTKKLAQLIEQSNRKIRCLSDLVETHLTDVKHASELKASLKEAEKTYKSKHVEKVALSEQIATLTDTGAELEQKAQKALRANAIQRQKDEEAIRHAESVAEAHDMSVQTIYVQLGKIQERQNLHAQKVAQEEREFIAICSHLCARENYIHNSIQAEIELMRRLAHAA